MTAVVVVLDRDSKPNRLAYFRSSAERIARELDADGPWPLHTGLELVDLAEQYEPRSVDHLAICAHGGPEWLLHSRTGVHVSPIFEQLGQVSTVEFCDAWAPVLTGKPFLSLCACLCSRSPTRWLRTYLGRVASPWGPRSYQRGGEASFSARVRDGLVYPHGLFPRVRGHMSAGDLAGNPLLREHNWPGGEKGVPLSMLTIPGEAGIGLRRWWVKTVRGKLAERWLLGDDAVVEEIAELWRKR